MLQLELNPQDPFLKQKQNILGHVEDETFLYGRQIYLDFEDHYTKNGKALASLRFIVYDKDPADLEKVTLRGYGWKKNA